VAGAIARAAAEIVWVNKHTAATFQLPMVKAGHHLANIAWSINLLLLSGCLKNLCAKRPKTWLADVILTAFAAFSIREKTLIRNPKSSINLSHPSTLV
jgi:hypothetical protein